MKLTLHIGQPKAGSTSIQDSLYAARADIRQYGCMYPENLQIIGRHHWLLPLIFDDPMRAPSVVNRMGFSVEAAKKAALEEWDNLLGQLEGVDVSNLILSSEVLFFSGNQEEAARARKYLQSLTDDIQVLAYIRSPVKRYLSRVQQGLKSNNKIFQPTGSNIIKVLESYKQFFGQPVRTRVFERSKLRNEDVVADFVDWASLPIPEDVLPKMQSNESVSAEGMAVLHEMAADSFPTNKKELWMKRKLFKGVLMADRSIESPTQPKLKPEISEFLTAQCTELPKLRDQYGLVFEDIDYSSIKEKPGPRIQITRIDEICAYDKGRKELVKQQAQKNFDELVNEKSVRRKLKALLPWNAK